MKPEEIEKRWKETIENIVREQFRKLMQIDFTCPYCGKKYTIKELGELEESEKCPCDTCQTAIDRCGCQMHLCSEYQKWKEGKANGT